MAEHTGPGDPRCRAASRWGITTGHTPRHATTGKRALAQARFLAEPNSVHTRDRLRVEFVGWLSARDLAVAEAAARISALISDDPGRDADVNANLYEYIGLDLPVLAVAPRGGDACSARGARLGVGADPGPEEIADGLAALMALRRHDRPADPDNRYDRQRLARRLADLLDEITT